MLHRQKATQGYLAGAGFITGQVLHVNGGDAMFLGAFRIS